MIASLRADNLKARKRPANWIMVGIFLAWIALLLYLVFFLVVKLNPQSIQGSIPASVFKRRLFPENFVPSVLNAAISIGAAIMIIFGALSTASEYGWSTVQTILIQKPGRSAVLGGKLLSLALAVLLISAAAFGMCALASYVVVTIDGSSSPWPAADILVKGFGALLLQLSVWTAFGAFLGIAFRSTAAAIGGGLVYLFVVEVLFGGFLQNTAVIREILKFLPGINASAMNTAFPLTIRDTTALAPLVDATRGVVTLFIYLVLFAVISFVLFRRRDVGA